MKSIHEKLHQIHRTLVAEGAAKIKTPILREPYYKTSDGLQALLRAQHSMKVEDPELVARIKALGAAFNALRDHMNARYIWD